MEPRSELGVVVGHYLGEAGAVMVWLVDSAVVCKRNSFTPVKITAEIIQTIQSRSADVPIADLDQVVFLDRVTPAKSFAPEAGSDSDLHVEETADIDLSVDPVAAPVLPPIPAQAPTIQPNADGGISGGASPPELAIPSIASPPLPTGSGVGAAVGTPPELSTPAIAGGGAESGTIGTTITVADGSRLTRTGRRVVLPARYARQQGLLAEAAEQEDAPKPTDGNFTIKQAMLLDKERATKAVRAELQQMLQLGVFSRQDRQLESRVLPSKMFLKWKQIDGEISFKARLVIGGHMQERSTMGETFSPTVNSESVNVVMALAAFNKRPLYTVDVSGAFLHVPLQGPAVHMRLSKPVVDELLTIDAGFNEDIRPDGTLTVRIRKAIYGLGESSRQWSEHLAATLSTLGYRRLAYDRSAFVKRDDVGGIISTLCVHVDDILAMDMTDNHQATLTTALKRAYGKITLVTGRRLTYLGVCLEQMPGRITLNQRPLIAAIKYTEPRSRVSNPAALDILDRDGAIPGIDPGMFRSTLMRVLYVTSKTRFDLMFATNALASHQQQCSRKDEEALAQLVRYLKDTADWDYVIAPRSLTLQTSADASYASHPDGRGHTGFACTIGGSTVYARSVKQRLVSKSSSEAELLALNLAVDETLYLRNLLAELGAPQTTPTLIDQDNKSAIIMAEKGELGTKRTKHFTVRHYFVSEQLRLGLIRLAHRPGVSILADGLTKALVGPTARTWARTLLDGSGEVANDAPHCIDRGGLLKKAVVPTTASHPTIPKVPDVSDEYEKRSEESRPPVSDSATGH
jgi:hypothetical protein